MLTLSLTLVLAPACEGDDGDDAIGEGETAGESDGDGDGDSGDGDRGDGDGDSGDRGDGDGDTGELMGCAALATEGACMAELGCAPVHGNLLVDDGNGGWCTETEEQFIGCASSSELCPMLGKTLCDGDTLWRTTECVPGNLTPCEAPGDITGTCEEGQSR